MAADGFPWLAFAVLLVKVLQELGSFFGREFARSERLLFLLIGTIAIARVLFGLLRLGLLIGSAVAVGTLFATAARLTLIALVLLILVLVFA